MLRHLPFVLASVTLGAAAQTSRPAMEPRAAIEVHHQGALPWSGIVPVSIPWPQGGHAELHRVGIAGEVVPCEPFLRWPDGSVAVVRAWPRLRLDAGSRTTLAVRALEGAYASASDEGVWYFDTPLPMHTVLVDPWGARFRAEFVPDEERGEGGLLLDSPRSRVRCFRSRHTNADSTNLGLRAYLRSWRGERRASLTVLLDNDPTDEASVLGPMRFREFRLCTTDPLLRVLPRFRDEDALAPPQRNVHGGFDQVLLAPSDQHYLGDRTAKAFRFELFLDGDAVSEVERRQAAQPRPLALPACSWVRRTRAFGAQGGPAPSEPQAAEWTRELLGRHRSSAGYGPWADRGDPAFAAVQGTRRNEPLPLRDVLRCQSPELLRMFEARFLQ
ncbi:MAG: hypothetical protein KDB80_04835, partial [Planctomycetes bacterium]|nr:hypothetical protein [Planctomycetota bacterium]